MKKLARYVGLPEFVACDNCSGGWVTLADGTVKRCACYLAHMEKCIQQIQAQARDAAAREDTR